MTSGNQELALAEDFSDKVVLSPTAQGEAHRRTVTTWIYRWGYSSSALIQQLLNKQASGWAARAAQRGLLNAHHTASGRPRLVYTLTQLGISIAQQHADLDLPYPCDDPARIQQHLIRHGLITQSLTLDALQAKSISAFHTEHEWSARHPSAPKQPDAVWLTPSGLRIGLEVELTPKWNRQLDHFVGAVIDSLTPCDGAPAMVDALAITSDSPGLLRRYHAALSPGASVNIWIKDDRSHWRIDGRRTVPKGASACIDFIPISTQLL